MDYDTELELYHYAESLCSQKARLDDLLGHSAVPLIENYWRQLQDRPSYREAVVDWHDELNWRSAIREIFGDGKSPRLDAAVEKLVALG